MATDELNLNPSMLNLYGFFRPFVCWPFFLAVLLAISSCEQSEEYEPPMQEHEDESQLAYDSLRDFVGHDWELDVEVVNTLLTHPSFQNVPPITATLGKSLVENEDERSEETNKFFHLGQGWFEDRSSYQSAGGSWTEYRSTGRTVNLLAGLLPFATWIQSTSTWKDDAPQTDFGGARITAIGSISGQIFPTKVGRSMTVDLVRSPWNFGEPLKQSVIWEVTRTVDGYSVGIPIDEPVFEIINTVTTTFENPRAIQSSKNNFYYVPSLGIAVRSGQYSDEYPNIKSRWSILE